jgi:acetyl-CoA synthetase
VHKVIGPFAALKKIYTAPDLPKTRLEKVCPYLFPFSSYCYGGFPFCEPKDTNTDSNNALSQIMRKIITGEGDQLSDLSTIAQPGVMDVIKQKVAERG